MANLYESPQVKEVELKTQSIIWGAALLVVFYVGAATVVALAVASWILGAAWMS